MKKILLILGVLLTLANNASSQGAPQPIPPESDNIISSPQKGKNESEVLDSTFGPNTPDDSPEWYWANGKPVFDYMLDPNTLDDSPEWYWANGKPLTKAPKDSELLNIMFGLNTLEP